MRTRVLRVAIVAAVILIVVTLVAGHVELVRSGSHHFVALLRRLGIL